MKRLRDQQTARRPVNIEAEVVTVGEKAPLSDLAEVVSVDQISETMQAAIGNSQYGPGRDEILPEDWVELEVAPAGFSLNDRDLPFLIAPACEIDAGHQVQLSGALLVTNLVFDDPEESEDSEEFDRAVYLATGFEDRGGGFWTLTSPRRGGRIKGRGQSGTGSSTGTTPAKFQSSAYVGGPARPTSCTRRCSSSSTRCIAPSATHPSS